MAKKKFNIEEINLNKSSQTNNFEIPYIKEKAMDLCSTFMPFKSLLNSSLTQKQVPLLQNDMSQLAVLTQSISTSIFLSQSQALRNLHKEEILQRFNTYSSLLFKINMEVIEVSNMIQAMTFNNHITPKTQIYAFNEIGELGINNI